MRFTHLLGDPGDPKDSENDYMILAADSDVDVKGRPVFELDPRQAVRQGERIWFPDKDRQSPTGYVWFAGEVTEVSQSQLLVRFDHPLKLQSQSGSPLLSVATGKVIGILRGSRSDGTVRFTPAISIVKAWTGDKKLNVMGDVVGKELGGP